MRHAMRRAFTAIAAWARTAYHVLKNLEEAAHYRYEDYAQDRFKRLEQRLATLEDQARK